MNEPRTLLGGLEPARFLAEYWQKRPLLVRQALPGFRSPLDPDELAGLACEADVESRIVLERAGPGPWTLETGPFDEGRFARLPATHWTLLVQECNRYLPELAELLERFDFIPNWRVDDVMVSYAPEHGSVGPHTDQYDVFLIQGLGRRRWRISTDPVPDDNLIPGLDLRILRDFRPTDEWILEPGDLLYLPPGMPHHGIALEDCMTFSVGFRAPSVAELLTACVDDLAAGLDETLRYHDPDLRPPVHRGEIDPDARARVRRLLREALADDATIDHWFGRFATENRSGLPAPPPATPLDETGLRRRLRDGEPLIRSEYARFAFIDHAGEGIELFVDGQAWRLPPALGPAVRHLCDHRRIEPAGLGDGLDDGTFARLLVELYNAGYIGLGGDDA